MTRQDRELAIADNLAYVAGGDATRSTRDGPARRASCSPVSRRAWRWRSAPRPPSARPVDGVIAVGGDVPPELDARGAGARAVGARLPRRARRVVHHGRSSTATSRRLREAGVAVRAARVRRRPRVVGRGGRAPRPRFFDERHAMTEIRSATSADAGALAELRWEFRAGAAAAGGDARRVRQALRPVDAPRAADANAWRRGSPSRPRHRRPGVAAHAAQDPEPGRASRKATPTCRICTSSRRSAAARARACSTAAIALGRDRTASIASCCGRRREA